MTIPNPEQLVEKRVEPELEFLNRFPDAREAVVYEFDTEGDAETAKALLMSTAFVAGKRGRVVRVPWKTKVRLMAVAHV
ncbi:MAG TPA: hypothetical protein VGJ60_07545 [Chloroflexota bacterium]|jgi:hypothetical protein